MPNSRHAEVIGITINDKEVISAKPSALGASAEKFCGSVIDTALRLPGV